MATPAADGLLQTFLLNASEREGKEAVARVLTLPPSLWLLSFSFARENGVGKGLLSGSLLTS